MECLGVEPIACKSSLMLPRKKRVTTLVYFLVKSRVRKPILCYTPFAQFKVDGAGPKSLRIFELKNWVVCKWDLNPPIFVIIEPLYQWAIACKFFRKDYPWHHEVDSHHRCRDISLRSCSSCPIWVCDIILPDYSFSLFGSRGRIWTYSLFLWMKTYFLCL